VLSACSTWLPCGHPVILPAEQMLPRHGGGGCYVGCFRPLGRSLVSAAMAQHPRYPQRNHHVGARVPFAAARDRLFPAAMATIHPRFQALRRPWWRRAVEHLACCWWDASSSSLSWRFLPSGSSICSQPRLSLFTGDAFPQRTAVPQLGYPALPALFIVAAAVLLYYSFASNVRSSLVGRSSSWPACLFTTSFAHSTERADRRMLNIADAAVRAHSRSLHFAPPDFL